MFREWELSQNTVSQRLGALLFFYTQVLKQAWSTAKTPYPKKVLRRKGSPAFQRLLNSIPVAREAKDCAKTRLGGRGLRPMSKAARSGHHRAHGVYIRKCQRCAQAQAWRLQFAGQEGPTSSATLKCDTSFNLAKPRQVPPPIVEFRRASIRSPPNETVTKCARKLFGNFVDFQRWRSHLAIDREHRKAMNRRPGREHRDVQILLARSRSQEYAGLRTLMDDLGQDPLRPGSGMYQGFGPLVIEGDED